MTGPVPLQPDKRGSTVHVYILILCTAVVACNVTQNMAVGNDNITCTRFFSQRGYKLYNRSQASQLISATHEGLGMGD